MMAFAGAFTTKQQLMHPHCLCTVTKLGWRQFWHALQNLLLSSHPWPNMNNQCMIWRQKICYHPLITIVFLILRDLVLNFGFLFCILTLYTAGFTIITLKASSVYRFSMRYSLFVFFALFRTLNKHFWCFSVYRKSRKIVHCSISQDVVKTHMKRIKRFKTLDIMKGCYQGFVWQNCLFLYVLMSLYFDCY